MKIKTLSDCVCPEVEQQSSGCPGNSMRMCYMSCPSNPIQVFSACVDECAKRCEP